MTAEPLTLTNNTLFLDENEQHRMSNDNNDLKRITSCFFSVKSALSGDEEGEEDETEFDEALMYDSLVDGASVSVQDEVSVSELGDKLRTLRTSVTSRASCCNIQQVNMVDELYHEVMFNIFSYLSANDLVSFSVAARRPNFDCFYYLQLKIEDALNNGMKFHVEDERQWRQMFAAGAGAVARLAALDPTRAEEIVEVYRNSNLPHGISLSLRAQLAAEAAQRNKGATMMLTALGGAAMMGNESAQALLSMGMCAQLVRSSMQNMNVKDVQEKVNAMLHMPHLPLPESGLESIFPSAVVSRLSQFAINHGFVSKDDSIEQIDENSKPIRISKYEHNESKDTDQEYRDGYDFQSDHKHQTVPSGCVGAYTKAVRESALAIRKICKERRQHRFFSLDPDFRRHLCSVFIDACSSDDNYSTVVNLIRDHGVDPNGFYVNADNVESCGLHLAASSGTTKILEFLCKGVDENDADGDGGLCDINILDDNGWSALHFAAGSNNVAAVRILASYGAELTIEAHNGYTPFHWAERLSNKEVVEELKTHKADKKFTFMFGTVQPLQQFADRFFAFAHNSV